MHFSRSYATVPLAALLLMLILLIGLHRTPRHTTGFQVKVPRDTCACGDIDDHLIVLRMSDGGRLSINSEEVAPEHLAGLLSDIYRTRAEKILYLSVDDDVSLQSVADTLDVAKHLPENGSPGVPVLHALQEVPGTMGIQVRVITRHAIDAACHRGCYNWANQGLPVVDEVRTSEARLVPQ